MQGSELRKTQYGFVDVMKFLLALLIVSSHFISENAVGRIDPIIDYASSLYVIVVPFFFVCSGFLLFRKLDGAFSSTRNGIFNGFPFVLIGYMIARKEKNGFTKAILRNLTITVVFGIGFVVEALVIKRLGVVSVNTLILLLPFTYFFLMWCLGVRMETTEKTIWLRKMSTDVFLCQRIFLSALPSLFPSSIFGRLLSVSPYVGWLSMIAFSLITASVLIEVSKRNKWLDQFC